MALYFVNYDLRRQRDYSELYEALQSLSAVKVLESVYCFRHNNTTAEALRDYFMQFIDGDDGVCVTEVTDWATYKTDGTPNDLS